VLLGFVALGIINAVMIVVKVPLPHKLDVRVYHHLYDAGQVLSLGLGASALVELWERWGPRRPVWGYLATAALAGVSAIPLLSVDLTGAVTTLTPGGHPTFFLGLFLAASGVALSAAALAGRLLGRPYLRLLPVLLGLAAGVANHLVLENDYPGVHFFLAWAAALFLGASLRGATLPAFLARRAPSLVRRLLPPYSPRVLWPVRAALCLVAAAALAVQPTNAVALELLRLPGTVVAPELASLRVTDFPPSSQIAGDEWFAPNRPDRPASAPSLLAPGSIVILVIIDAVRADLVNSGKYADKLPALEALRQESVQFTSARSPTTGTIWTLSTLFSDRYYSQLYWSVKASGVSAKVYPHEDGSTRFPEILSRGGVRTAIYSEMPDATNAYGVVRGFDEEEVFKGRAGYTDKVMSAAMERLGKQGPSPLFFYVHFLEPHSPYDRAGTRGSAFDRYLREVMLVDEQVGKLRSYLAASGLDRRTTLIVTADHGEAFGEHHTEYHGVSVYEELVRVPLLVRMPGVAPATIERDVSLIDLAPTVLDLFGQATPGAFMGQSLVPYLRGEDPVLTRPLVFDTGRWQQAMIFPDRMKVIRDRRKGTFELYDLASDPKELDNLFDRAGVAEERADRLSAFFYVHTLRRPGYRVPFRP
jgi:hypothetical protein